MSRTSSALELVRLLGGEVVLANQVRTPARKFLVLEHQDLGVENARLVHTGAIFGFGPQILEIALHILHRGAQAAHLFSPLVVRGTTRCGTSGMVQRTHDRGAETDPGRRDALELPVAHSGPSFSRCSASAAPPGAARRQVHLVEPVGDEGEQRVHRRFRILTVGLDGSDDPHSAASIITPMMLLPVTARSSLRTSTADLKRLASFRTPPPGAQCMPSGFTILASRSITAINHLPAPRRRGGRGRAAPP